MAKEYMEIIAYSDSKYNGSGSSSCKVQINPASYTHDLNVSYNNQQPLGTPGTSLWFKNIPPEKVSFEIYFDATGAVSSGSSTSLSPVPVKDQIDKFKDVCYNYNGSIHQPNYLKLSWGTLVFKCKLTSLSISYTLFRNDGTPLRAKLTTTFEEALDVNTIAKQAKNQSPDMTHRVKVREGDTLPLICYRVYGDSRYYMKVAAYNNLINFRKLKPGTDLYLPPVK